MIKCDKNYDVFEWDGDVKIRKLTPETLLYQILLEVHEINKKLTK